MSKFDVIEVPFEPGDFETSLEDEFLLTKIMQDIDKVDDLQTMKEGARKLAQIAIQRQGLIRGLCKRLAGLECNIIRQKYDD
jgi:hypothetical protein